MATQAILRIHEDAEPGATAQRPQLSRVVLAHAPRQPGSWLTSNVRQSMKHLISVLVVILPFVIAALIGGTPYYRASHAVQTAQLVSLWLCPIVGIVCSCAYTFLRKDGRWFYVLAGIGYAVQLGFVVLIFGSRWA